MKSRNLSKDKREKLISKILEQMSYVDDDTKAVFREVISELNKKKYGLVWEEHSEAAEDEMVLQIPVFEEEITKQVIASGSESYNFLLQGDNLHCLQLLNKTHKGKIDVIYIDPPYNLGGDFIYNDNYVEREDGYRHSKWLSFMEKRLRISHELMSSNGVIFISINDSEYAALKLLCDDIFSEANYQATFIWKSRQRADSRNVNMISSDHEYILVYSKSDKFHAIGAQKDTSKYKNPDNDPRGPWASIDLSGLADSSRRPNLHYNIINPKTGIAYPPNPNRGWSKSKDTIARMIAEDRILWPASPNGRPREKKFLKDLLSETTGFSSVLNNEDVGYTTDGTRALISVLGARVFNFPKSVKLLKTLIGQFPSSSCTVLDYFAGSGSTAQAVLELNEEDGGTRTFILCTNNENGICEDVTYPRVKTIITGIRDDGSRYSGGIGANLKYYKTSFIKKKRDGTVPRELLGHIKEMIQLENQCNIDNSIIRLVLSEDELDDVFESSLDNCHRIYIPSDVLLTSKQKAIVEDKMIEVINIPEYFFAEELREVDEI